MEQILRKQMLAFVGPPPGLEKESHWDSFFSIQGDQSTECASSERSMTPIPSFDDSYNDDNNRHNVEIAPRSPQTTLIVRNLVGDCTKKMLMEFINRCGFSKKYDLLYLPQRFAGGGCFHYAFVNFVTEGAARAFQSSLHGRGDTEMFGDAIAEVEWSECQGLKANIAKFRNSSVMHSSVDETCKPSLLHNGKVVPFPRPTKKIKPDRKNRKPLNDL